MQEVKKPRKPLIYYYVIVLAVLLLFNFLFMPWAAERQVQEVGYDTFIEMTEKEEIGQVQINQEDNEVIFTNKEGNQIYKTGMVEDPGMTERLYASGAEFSGQIIEQMSPVLSFILSWILPIAIFIGIGQYMSRKLMNRAGGGPDSMIFGMGKSNAKVYVKSSEGIRFSDVAREYIESSDKMLASDGEPEFKPGDRVLHFMFGEGTVLSVMPQDAALTVKFDKIATPRHISFRVKLKRLG